MNTKENLDKLLRYSKIANVYHGILDVNTTNLKVILESLPDQNPDIPVSIVAVIGPKESGKSFLTNFLIQYAYQNGDGGWMSDITSRTKDGKPMMERGYAWNSVKSDTFFQGDRIGGIYLWPEPYLLTKGGNEKIMVVWIMHMDIHRVKDETAEPLEKFLALACSSILEIKLVNNNEIRLLDAYQRASSSSRHPLYPTSEEDFCKDVLLAIRAKKKISKKILGDKEAKEKLLENIDDPEQKLIYNKLLQNFQNLRVAWLADISNELHSKDGVLNEAALKMMSGTLKNIVAQFLDDQEISQKTSSEGEWTLGNMEQFIKNLANKANGLTEERAGRYTHTIGHQESKTSTEMFSKKLVDIHQTHLHGKECLRNLPSSLVTNVTVEVTEKSSEYTRVETWTKYRSPMNDKEPTPNSNNSGRLPVQETCIDDDDMQVDGESVVVDNQNTTNNGSKINGPLVRSKPSIPELMKMDVDNIPADNTPDSTSPMELDYEEETMNNCQQKAENQAKSEDMEKAKKAEKTGERERIQQDRKEKLRREEDEARKIMESELLPVAISQIEKAFPLSMKHWFKNEFNRSKIAQIETIYDHVIDGVTEEYRSQIPNSKVRAEFVQRLEKHCKPKCIEILKGIRKQLQSFNQRMEKQFTFQGYFSPKRLEQLAHSEFDTATKTENNDDLSKHILNLAADKLTTIYQEHNKIITDHEKGYTILATKQLTDVYHQQMKRYLKKAPYIAENLQRIHWKLREKLVEAFKLACAIQTASNESLTSAAKNFEDGLNPLFLKYKNENESVLRTQTQEISRIRESAKHGYNAKVETEILAKYLDGVEENVITQLHEKVKTEVMKLLEMEIRHKAPNDLESQKQTFKTYIDDYWPEILQINKTRLMKKLEKEEAERKQREEQEKPRQNREAEDMQNRGKSSSRSAQTSSTKPTHSTSPKSQPIDPVLSPLVFHLQSSRVVMATAVGVDSNLRLIPNEFGESETPGIVARSPNKTLIYGTEAVSSKESCGFVYTIQDFFATNNLDWSKPLSIEGKDYQVGIEFLLGFLLGKLKRAAELEMKGRFETALIAIPFWLSSPQRLKVKHAAKVAGFLEVYLVNEASAAAYNLVLGDKRAKSSNEVLVISENMGNVDTFVYTYFGNEKKIKMVGNSSNYGVNHWDVKNGLLMEGLNTFKRKATQIYNFVSQKPSPSEQEKMVKDVRHACRYAVELAGKELRNGSKVETNESFYIHENQAQWEAVLEKVVQDFGRRPGDIEENRAVLTGAVWLSKQTKEIGSLIKDKMAHDVYRIGENGAVVQVISTRESLPVTSKQHTSPMSNKHEMATFYQSVSDDNHQVGILKVRGGVTYAENLEPVLDISHEAIVSLKSVLLRSKLAHAPCYVEENKIQWGSPNLESSQLEALVKQLVLVLGPPVSLADPALIQKKDDVLRTCDKMMKKVNSGEYKIKSSLVRELVIEKISTAKNIAENLNCNSRDILIAQLHALQKVEEKYKK